MSITLTPADKTIVGASISTERLTGRFFGSKDFRVTIVIDSLRDVDLVKPLTFSSDVRLSDRVDGQDFETTDLDAPVGWRYDDETDRTRYYYSEDETDFVLVHDALVREVDEMLADFIWRALWDAERAYEEARDKALGL